MKILITGNMGYIGPCVVEKLKRSYPDSEIIGCDMGYFAHCLTGAVKLPECRVHKQYFTDVRHSPNEMYTGINVVVYLAAVSNDPMGNFVEKPTYQINCEAAVSMAKRLKDLGARSFIYASSCSLYGAASDGKRKETDPLNPLTSYARSKVHAEQELEKIADEKFVVTSLRFSTACGMSERLRLDLVLNDFVASAVATNNITILSDGTPFRPLIHIKDMARAIDWAVERTGSGGGNFLAVNIGRDDWNWQIKDLAEGVADVIPNIDVSINSDAQPDKRSYQVNFDLFKQLAPDYQPQFGLKETIEELQNGLEIMKFDNPNFRSSWFMRLNVLKEHINSKRLDKDLNWIGR